MGAWWKRSTTASTAFFPCSKCHSFSFRIYIIIIYNFIDLHDLQVSATDVTIKIWKWFVDIYYIYWIYWHIFIYLNYIDIFIVVLVVKHLQCQCCPSRFWPKCSILVVKSCSRGWTLRFSSTWLTWSLALIIIIKYLYISNISMSQLSQQFRKNSCLNSLRCLAMNLCVHWSKAKADKAGDIGDSEVSASLLGTR